jgi:hypothetical protein
MAGVILVPAFLAATSGSETFEAGFIFLAVDLIRDLIPATNFLALPWAADISFVPFPSPKGKGIPLGIAWNKVYDRIALD